MDTGRKINHIWTMIGAQETAIPARGVHKLLTYYLEEHLTICNTQTVAKVVC